nr:Protein CHROMATIN REMODELING 4 [Ipomoea batatas]
MKEDVAEASKMLNKNWVLKRKRRKIPSGLDSSTIKEENSQPLESVLNNPSSKRGVKDEVASTRSSSKKKGNDGYYYECVVCDLGGNLLCCESCPRTYHIQCLEPPLKRIPTGKWECPSCNQKTDPLGPTSPLDSVSKRARTKVTTTGKSKNENKSSGSTKMSMNIGGSILDNRRLSSKEKSSLSQRVQKEKLDPSPNSVSSKTKLNHASGDGSAGCSSSYVSVEDESEEKKPISPGKGVTSLSNVIDSETNEEASVRRPRLSSTDKSPMDKCTTLMDSASRKDRKRKHDFFPVDSWKKRRTDKSNHTAKTKKGKSESNCAHPGANKSQRKLKSINHESSKILPEQDVGKDTVDEHLKEQIVSEGASHPSNELGKVTVEPVTNEESGLDALQVDRVLGCRVRDADARNSCNTLVAPANDPQSEGSPVPKDENQLNEIASTDGSQGLADCPDEGRITENDIAKDKFQVYRRSAIKECKEGVNSVRTEDEVSGDYLANEEEFAKTSEKTSKETDSCVEIHDSNDNMECSQNFASNQLGNAKVVDTALETSSTSQKKHKGSTLAESSNSNGVTVSYEFLIKWVGKSNIHNTWLPESELKTLAKRKLDNYKAKYGTATINICEEQWKIPQRVIAVRSASNGATEVFVKWTGLSYDECTWERIDEPVISKASHLIDLFHRFESQALDKDAIKDDTLKKRNEQQSDIASLTEQPKELHGGLLFPHQMEALNWLRRCWYKSKNVILADEMGLGKTVSACAFLSSVYFEFKARLPSLVLVPLSTLPNWMAEFALWAPELNVVDYHGSSKARTIIRQYEWHASNQNGSNKKTTSYKFNVLLTTYEMVLADLSNLRAIPWEVLVVDEGHRLKNSSSKLFGSLNTFSFQHRVLLTGTPLQNNIGEMYNLLNFLQPTSFPSLSSFEQNFNDLTTAEKVDELKKLVAPHMLRRLKKDAMQNIPPKTERMVPVELTSIQAEYYRAMLTKNYQVLRNIGKGVAQQSMLNIVMQLRKVCNHPYLIPGTEPETGSLEFLHEMRIKASAKLTLLHSMLKILHKEGHRVLIFSQMTKLLDILEDYLTIEFGPKTYERVDGSVSVADRQASIARFNQDKSRFVFLLSTRSCGLGINLATADTVVIYDSDFNPHADIQAMNRAHRIGQSNRLLVYRLVVRASVEERILQLAKKKLMLDQLFVNKSGSQKEVEDILRWGTEELFSDSSNTTGNGLGENLNNKIEAVMELEQKHRRKTGSLGDVYKDKCAEISPKIVWDENAIFKLLDRSNLQSDSPDSNEAELESDMLGSVKASEWNEEATEEQAGEMMLANDDTSTQNLEKKEDNLIGSSTTEENEWDRLLRVRWEKYQSEEEAVLGRGKRQRKAVSYREAYAAHPNETLSESGAEEDQEQKPEPDLEREREYTPAGRALKAKYTRLRARQKERLAKRNAKETSAPVEGSTGTQYFAQLLQSQAQDGNQSALFIQPSEENSSALFLDGSSSGQTSEGRKNRTDSTVRLVKLPKHLGQPNLGEGPSYMNSEAENPLVIGLCAPNANPMESSQRKFSRSYNRKNRLGLGSDLPPSIAPCPTTSDEMGTKAHETISGRFKLPDPPLDVSQSRPKISIPDLYHPFNPHPLIFQQGKGSTVNLENSASSFAAFQEKMALPKLPFDEKLLPRYPFPTGNFPRPHPDLFPSLSLGSRVADVNEPHHDHPTMPLFPNLKFPMPDAPRCNQPEPEVPPTLGLGQMPSKLSPFPENHRKVLENIMLRTGSGSGSGNPFKKKSKMDIWSEEELDNLWIGVRRHGRGNWDAMLRDPRLKFSKFKTVEDLSIRWEEEQTKILDVPAFPGKGLKPPKSGKSSLFPSVSDGMMTRALHGSKFSGPPLKFQNQLTDLKLGFGDLPPSLSRLEHADHLSRISPLPPWNPDKYPLNVPGDLNAGPSDRLGAPSKFLMESPLLLSSLGTSSLGSLGVNCPPSFSLPQKEAEESASRFGKLSSILDRSLNFLPDSNNNVGNGESSGFALPSDVSKGKNIPQSKGKEVAECSSPKNKLPHWLQEAVNVPPKSAAPSLPPTLSAISHSLRLLYGEEGPTIPPFTVPGPLPSQPKDPRLSLKKKKKKKQKLHMIPEFLQTLKGSGDTLQSHLPGEKTGSSVVPQDQSSLMLLKSLGSTSESPSVEPDLGMSTLSQNVMNPSSLPVNPSLQKMTTPGPGLSPSPEVLQLVASCVAPDPPPSLTTDINENTAPPPLSADEGTSRDTHEKANDASAPGKSGSSEEDKDQSESRDSSQTQSDPARGRQHAVEEISSEGTVSDHLAIEP